MNFVCLNNNLTSLDLSQNPDLHILSCGNNNLSSLDLSHNPNLGILSCYENNLSALDLSQNNNLVNLSCYDNNLIELDIKNISVNNIYYFDATLNPDLTCIQVDDVAAAAANFTDIDPQTSFSTSCTPVVNIPDANFKACLVSNSAINTNGDSEIQVSEANAYAGEIVCQSAGISDLSGIEAFTALTALDVVSNNISNIDVSQNIALAKLHCGNNSNLSAINVSQNTALTDLNTFYCTALSTLDISHNTALEKLVVAKNNLVNIDLSHNAALEHVQIQDNALSSLDLSQNTALKYLVCEQNNLSSLDLSQNVALENLNCSQNALSFLDLSYNTALKTLNASFNNLNSLDLSQNTVLEEIVVAYNSLTSLSFGPNNTLTLLNCSFNNISTLEVSQSPALNYLYCRDNALSTLDVSQNANLMEFNCQDNQIGVLDVSQSLGLLEFNCNSNNLTVLDMKNISTNQLDDFEADENPNLTCIEVDDVAAAGATWTGIDPQTSFSENCGYIIPVSSIFVQGQGGVSSITTLGGTLQMEAAVSPVNANDNTYTWSVYNGTGEATIDQSGLLTALTDGTVTVTATANDGSGVFGSTEITISNQTTNTLEQNILQDLSIYPNPFTTQIIVGAKSNVEFVSISDITGSNLKAIVNPDNSVDVSDLTKGVYFLQIQVDGKVISKMMIKE